MTSPDAYIIVAVIAAAMVLVALWTALCICIGYRMGLRAAGKPVEPLIQPKGLGKDAGVAMDFDPYHEPMHGKPPARIPTVEG